MLEELTTENKGLFEIATVNVDANRTISMKLGVQNIPAMILFKNGNEIRRFTGLQNKKILLTQIVNALKD
jgi:thioredoxin 1